MKKLCLSILLLFLISKIDGVTVDECRVKRIEEGGPADPDSEMCVHKPFTGPVATIIATSEPTRLSKYAVSHSKTFVNNMATFASFLPVVGGYVSFGLNQFSKFGFKGTGGIINEIIADIENQLDSLKEYVDNKVQELEHTQLTQGLTGIFATAESCADYDKEDQIQDLERCLISLNTIITGMVGRFMPENDNIISYDWVLPLFRQYADMQITVTQDLLRVAMKLEKKSAQEDYIDRLKEQTSDFYSFTTKAINRIVQVHTSFKAKTCRADINWWNPSNPFSTADGYYGECSQVFFNGRLCKERIIAREAEHGPEGRNSARTKAGQCVDGYANKIKSQLEKDLRKYWKLELLDSAENWKKVGEEAEKIDLSSAKAKSKAKKTAKRRYKFAAEPEE